MYYMDIIIHFIMAIMIDKTGIHHNLMHPFNEGVSCLTHKTRPEMTRDCIPPDGMADGSSRGF
jgi:hypothetical protein